MRRLPVFLAVSLAVHAGAALALIAHSSFSFPGSREPSLSVRLVARDELVRSNNDQGAVAQPHPVRQPMPPRQHYASIVPAEAKPAPTKAGAATGSTRPTAHAAKVDPSADRDAIQGRVRAQVLSDLARYFEYPSIARLRGWEGEVRLAFHVEPDGSLQDIHVARSSGVAVLDAAAVNSLRQVPRVEEAVDKLDGRRLALELPVVYRLEGDR